MNAGTFQLSVARQYYRLSSNQKDGRVVYHLDNLTGPVQVGDTLAVRITVGGNDWRYLMIEDPIPSGTESIARDDLYELDDRPNWWGRVSAIANCATIALPSSTCTSRKGSTNMYTC